MKVAIVHDYLKEFGGAERVVLALHDIFPEAPIYTAYYDPKGLGQFNKLFKGIDIRTSWFQHFPFAGKIVSPFRLFAPQMFESFDLSDYDVVISSSAIYFAKAVITKPETLHLGYIHTPPKYLYGYATSFNYKKHWWTRLGAAFINHFLLLYDFETSQRPDILIANSQCVASRIEKFYRRKPIVIYPPVDVKEFKIQNSEFKRDSKKYYLSLNRLWKGKGTDLVVKACSELGVPLKVAGTGPELENLKKIASSDIEFLGSVSDEERVALLRGAKALIVAVEDEDFGINAVESMAAGTPVIALKRGGYLETVVEGKTGEFFDEMTPASLIPVLQNFDPSKYKADDCLKQAEKFSTEKFKEYILKSIKDNFKG